MAKDVKKQFGARLKQLRHAKKLSQEELANKTSLHRTYISDIERGDRNVSLENIHKLAKGLGVHTNELF